MKGTDNFKKVVLAFLTEKAESNSLFAKAFNKENKNIDDCVTFILNQVKESGACGFEDFEIYNMAIHYYEEDNVTVGDVIDGNIVVNHHVQLTAEEIAKAKDEAINQVVIEHKMALKRKADKKNAPSSDSVSPTLF